MFGHAQIHYFDKTHVLLLSVELIWLLLLNNTFFQLCSKVEQIFVRLTRIRRSYVTCPLLILTSHTQTTQHFCLMCAVLFKVGSTLFKKGSNCVPFLQRFVSDDSVFSLPIFVEHTSCWNVVNSSVGKETKRRKDAK